MPSQPPPPQTHSPMARTSGLLCAILCLTSCGSTVRLDVPPVTVPMASRTAPDAAESAATQP